MKNINTFSIKTGRMLIEGGKVKPLATKGELIFYINPDSKCNFVKKDLTCFKWKSLENNEETEPTVIFGNEWEWSKVQTGKGRLYNLKNTCFEDTQNFFWMQVLFILS